MNIFHVNLEQPLVLEEEITACIGYFDGLHLGHQKLVEEVLRIAKENGTQPSLITFDPDPWAVLKGMKAIPHITPMEQRIRIGEKLGIQNWIILDFSLEMAHLSYEEFHHRVLEPLHLHTLVCGYDFHYASKGEGNTETLKAQNAFAVSVISEVSSEHKKISSSRIEELITEGRVDKAAAFMGRFYDIEGSVRSGSRMGRDNGFPTANLQMEHLYVLPKKGVYIGAVRVLGAWHQAIINVGNNPTFNYQEQLSIEAHILNFQESIYGEAVTFRFCEFIREEQKFADAAALAEQLRKDVQSAIAYFSSREEKLLCD